MSEIKNKYVILKPYQFRVLRLLYNRPYFIKELNHQAELSHSPNVIKYLRDNGLDVISEFYQNPENTPVKTRHAVVKYSIHPDSRRLALDSLNHYQGLD